ncbi:MAG: hypothetical protein ACRELB_23640, partial [Polyangiaceae bacterium]
EQIAGARADERAQAAEIVAELKSDGATVDGDSEVVALIAYLQHLGKHPEPAAPPGQSISLAK